MGEEMLDAVVAKNRKLIGVEIASGIRKVIQRSIARPHRILLNGISALYPEVRNVQRETSAFCIKAVGEIE